MGSPSPRVLTVNVGGAEPNPYKREVSTGIGKRPVAGRVEVRAPGPEAAGLGSGLVGDHIGDRANHGGHAQAVYLFARSDLDHWQARLGRELPNGFFGENLTVAGVDPNQARIGEIWQVGPAVRLRITVPRIPCATFRGWMGEPGWLKTFTAAGRPGGYAAVEAAGSVGAGDRIVVCHRPDHDVTIAEAFAALTLRPDPLAGLLRARDDLESQLLRASEAAAGLRS